MHVVAAEGASTLCFVEYGNERTFATEKQVGIKEVTVVNLHRL